MAERQKLKKLNTTSNESHNSIDQQKKATKLNKIISKKKQKRIKIQGINDPPNLKDSHVKLEYNEIIYHDQDQAIGKNDNLKIEEVQNPLGG